MASVAVVKERIAGFLQQALLVVEYGLGCLHREKPLQSVVTGNDALVKDVEIAGGEATAVHWHQGA